MVKLNYILILILAAILALALVSFLHKPVLAAFYNDSVSNYASSSVAISTGNVTLMFWSNKVSDTSVDFGVIQGAAAGVQNFGLIQRGAGVGNVAACLNHNGGIGANGAKKPNYGVWTFYVCKYLTGAPNTYDYRAFNIDRSLYDSGTGTDATARSGGTEFDVGVANGASNPWSGQIRNVMVVDAYLSDAQVLCYAFASNPYSCGGGVMELYCPLTGGTDPRCWTPAGRRNLTIFGTPPTTKDPVTTPKQW